MQFAVFQSYYDEVLNLAELGTVHTFQVQYFLHAEEV